MINQLVIITGSSRGIGRAVAEVFLNKAPDNFIIGVARTAMAENTENSKTIQADLSHLEGCESLLAQLISFVDNNPTKKLLLINNAGRLGDVLPSYQTTANDLAQTVFLNMTAPMILQNGLLALSVEKSLPLEIVNISSGAARHEYYGWSGYCATKAGFLMATQVLGLEINQLQHNAKVWSLAPGIVDTAMQDEIRSRTPEQFAEVERFKTFHAEGQLRSPESVADFIFQAVGNEKFQNGGFYDIRDL